MKLQKKLLFTLTTFLSLAVSGFAVSSPASASMSNKKVAYSTLYKVAKAQLGKPYSWGATGPSSFDCSGLTSYIYKKGAGISIPRTAAAQYSFGKRVSVKNLKKGDLVFFTQGSSMVSHTGFYVGNGKMIDAQNHMTYDPIINGWEHCVGGARMANVN